MSRQGPGTSLQDSTTICELADMLDEALLLTDASGVVLSANKAAGQLFDAEIIGASIFDLIDDGGFNEPFRKVALERTVDVHLSRLRKAMNKPDGQTELPNLIRTVRGSGYALRVPQ